MSFLLCHDCYTWVEPEDNRCPECLLIMDLSESDPPSDLLRKLMGEIVDRLGEVRIPRRLLPEWGTLYATTQGLFFVPHEIDDSLSAPTGGFERPSWSVGRLIRSPLHFLRPFLPVGKGESAPRTLRPRYLSEEDSHLMPDLLMENPGAFFLPKVHIRAILRKRSRWLIERTSGSRFALSPGGSAKPFHEQFQALLEAPEWRIGE